MNTPDAQNQPGTYPSADPRSDRSCIASVPHAGTFFPIALLQGFPLSDQPYPFLSCLWLSVIQSFLSVRCRRAAKNRDAVRGVPVLYGIVFFYMQHGIPDSGAQSAPLLRGLIRRRRPAHPSAYPPPHVRRPRLILRLPCSGAAGYSPIDLKAVLSCVRPAQGQRIFTLPEAPHAPENRSRSHPALPP